MTRALLPLLLVIPAFSALAQSPAELRRYVDRENRRGQCASTGFNVIHQGPLLMEPRFLSIIHSSTEGCGGGNSYGSSVRVFVKEGTRLRELPATLGRNHPDQIERVRMNDSTILVEGLSHGPDDPRCCPTLRRSQGYTVMDGRMVPVAIR